ncbi:hypothetical protein Pmani_037792 [Petrolisthes manimaculis]|uniref:Uncharacterized protein n=1 Tax=Petrolisthes manimaculis TaxID=1843537 RepID=A0AAE1TL33_9EUCA|nr:hypothetical protein Pmani_037792 [Petrolisthes manimaculis]
MFNRHFKNHCIISPSGTSTTLSKSLPLKSTTTQLLAQVGGAAALVRTPRPPHGYAGPNTHITSHTPQKYAVVDEVNEVERVVKRRRIIGTNRIRKWGRENGILPWAPPLPSPVPVEDEESEQERSLALMET